MTIENLKKDVYIALGSNLGDRLLNFEKAGEFIAATIGEVVRQSVIYKSKAQGYTSDNEYYNAVISCQTSQSPEEVLKNLLYIEKKLGRVRTSASYQDRLIDLDLLLYDTLQVKIVNPDLIVPHPRMFERGFVLIPLLEVATKELEMQLKKMMPPQEIEAMKQLVYKIEGS